MSSKLVNTNTTRNYEYEDRATKEIIVCFVYRICRTTVPFIFEWIVLNYKVVYGI